MSERADDYRTLEDVFTSHDFGHPVAEARSFGSVLGTTATRTLRKRPYERAVAAVSGVAAALSLVVFGFTVGSGQTPFGTSVSVPFTAPDVPSVPGSPQGVEVAPGAGAGAGAGAASGGDPSTTSHQSPTSRDSAPTKGSGRGEESVVSQVGASRISGTSPFILLSFTLHIGSAGSSAIVTKAPRATTSLKSSASTPTPSRTRLTNSTSAPAATPLLAPFTPQRATLSAPASAPAPAPQDAPAPAPTVAPNSSLPTVTAPAPVSATAGPREDSPSAVVPPGVTAISSGVPTAAVSAGTVEGGSAQPPEGQGSPAAAGGGPAGTGNPGNSPGRPGAGLPGN